MRGESKGYSKSTVDDRQIVESVRVKKKLNGEMGGIVLLSYRVYVSGAQEIEG